MLQCSCANGRRELKLPRNEGIERLVSSLKSPAELAARRSVVLNLHFIIIITRAASSSASGGGRWGSGIATWQHARWERLRYLLPTKGGLVLCHPHNLADRHAPPRQFVFSFCRCPSVAVQGQTKKNRKRQKLVWHLDETRPLHPPSRPPRTFKAILSFVRTNPNPKVRKSGAVGKADLAQDPGFDGSKSSFF